jgi:nucleotide-binding universal stress UspA family protein
MTAMTAMTAHASGAEFPGGTRGERVIVGIDDSPGGLAALRWAVELARSRGAALVAVRVWGLALPRHGGRRHRGDGHGRVVFAFRGAAPRQAATELTRQALRAVTRGAPTDLDVTIETPEGDPGPVLTTVASAGTDVLVVGTAHHPSLKRMVHGSVSAYCSRRSHCPVVVIEAGRPRWYPGHAEATLTANQPSGSRPPGSRMRRS